MARSRSTGKSRAKPTDHDRRSKDPIGRASRPTDRSGADQTREARTGSKRRSLLPILVVLAGLVAYANSFCNEFVFDDDKHIVNNPRIRQIVPLSETMGGRRPILDLSLAVNHRVGGLKPRGYHAFNLAVHLLAGLTLFGIVRRTLQSRVLRDQIGPVVPWLATVVAMIWVVHPLQTQSVAYVIQRGESLMGLFYLLTLYCVIRGAGSTDGKVGPTYSVSWYAAAIICCALGMGSKAVIVTAPLMVLLYDRTFISKSLAEIVRRRWILYLGLMATWGVLAISNVAQGVLSTTRRGATVGFSFKGCTPGEYLVTQAGAIAHYVRLSLWPHPLCLDYAWPVARTVGDIVLPGLVIALLLAGTVWGLTRKPALGFVGVWFFLTLAPTSSFIPFKDPVFEHRMYLPLAAVIVLAVIVGSAALRRLSVLGAWSNGRLRSTSSVLVALVVMAFVHGTLRRNLDYRSEMIMWRDVVVKQPNNPRAHLGIGTVLFSRGKAAKANSTVLFSRGKAAQASKAREEAKRAFASAEAEFLEAVRLRPYYADGHYNLGNAQHKIGKLDEAVASFRRSLRYRPRSDKCLYNLANAYKDQKKLDKAIATYRKAIEIKPDHISAHINLGNALRSQGRLDEAIIIYHRALEINPRYANAHFNLGYALRNQGKLEAAVKRFQTALEYDPKHRGARLALDAALRRLDESNPD